MTFDEAKELLADMRAAKRRANTIKARIADLESDYESINSALKGDSMSRSASFVSKVEQLVLKVEEQRERHIRALEDYWEMEDRLAEAINSLSDEEREIVLGYYLDGKRIWQVAEDLNYSERSIKYIKVRAIKKIAKKL